MHVVVFGATGGTGRAVIRALLEGGHAVTAFARLPERLDRAPDLAIVQGDALNQADVARAVRGHDAVLVTLGGSQSRIVSRLGAKRSTSQHVCEIGTRHVVAAMREAALRRLVCVTAYGVGDTRPVLPWTFRLFYALMLREQMADKEKQEQLVKQSGLDWTLVQPVGLTNAATAGPVMATSDGTIRKSRVSRAGVASVIVGELVEPRHLGETLSVSG